MHFLDCAPLSQEESSVCNSDLEFLCSLLWKSERPGRPTLELVLGGWAHTGVDGPLPVDLVEYTIPLSELCEPQGSEVEWAGPEEAHLGTLGQSGRLRQVEGTGG